MGQHTSKVSFSVYDRAWQEANCHKWIESEKTGCDLGYQAIQDWDRQHFKKLYRWCHWLHLTGRQFFGEFPSEHFGTLTDPNNDMEQQVVTLFWDGKENLEIYCSAHGCGWDLERLHRLLLSLDINGTRLNPLVA